MAHRGATFNSVKDGGDYLKPMETYPLAELGTKTATGNWLFYLEGVTPGSVFGGQQIRMQVDPKGDGNFIEGDTIRASVIMAAIISDYNHNREIDDEDRNRAARGDTYYFWINDDDDAGETEGDDIPKEETIYMTGRDCDDHRVDGVRDLIDFFPVVLDIGMLLDLFPPEVYDYKLKTAENNLNVILSDLAPITVSNYLIDVLTARRIAKDVVVYPISDSGDFTGNRINTAEGRQAFKSLLQSMSSQRKSGVLLVEGHAPGRKPMVLEISDEAGQQVFTTSLNLSLDGVEQMFRHVNVIQEVGGPPPGDLPSGTRFGGMKSRYVNEGEEPANFPDTETEPGENFVFLHGYNVNGQQARGYQTEMFKKLYWSGMRAKFWGISWFGFESQNGIFTPNFHINVVNAIETGSILASLLPTYIKEGEITIAAHSLGNAVAASMISDHYANGTWPAPIRKVYMIDAAIAMETLDGAIPEDVNMYHPKWWYHDLGQTIYKTDLWASKWYQLFDDHVDDTVTDARESLTWRNRYGRFSEMCRNSVNDKPQIDCYNFYSEGEEVLATHDDPGLLWDTDPNYLEGVYPSGRYAFALQERLKGRVTSTWMKYLQGVYDENDWEFEGVYIAGSPYGGWGFNLADSEYARIKDPVTGEKEPIYGFPANTIPVSQLKSRPFFKLGPPLTDLLGEATLGTVDNKVRDQVLSEAIPALTLPAGGPGGRPWKILKWLI